MKSLFSTLRRWEQDYALTFWGLAAGIVSIVSGVVFFLVPYLEKKNPNLRMEVVSKANVIDVREKLSDLDIFYKGLSLRTNQQTLAVVTLKISNDGSAPIPIGAYDPSSPVGIVVSEKIQPKPPETDLDKKITAKVDERLNEITKGATLLAADDAQKLPFSLSPEPTITKAELIAASRPYLSSNVKIDFSPTNATFRPVILQTGDFFEMKLLVLHDETKDFEIKPTGEIAGVKEITLLGLNSRQDTPSPLRQAFTGGPFVQIMRLIGYFLGSLSMLFLGGVLLFHLKDFRDKRKRKIQIQLFRQFAVPQSMPEYSWVLQAYIQSGPAVIRAINEVVQNPQWGLKAMVGYYFNSRAKTFDALEKMRETGALSSASGKEVVNVKFKDYMQYFSSYFKKELTEDTNEATLTRASVTHIDET